MQLYQFVSSEKKGIHFAFATSSEHEEEAKLLAERYSHCRTVPGTPSMHCVIPVTTSTVEVRQFSYSPTRKIEKVSTALNVETLPLSTIKGYELWPMVEIVGLDVSQRLTWRNKV